MQVGETARSGWCRTTTSPADQTRSKPSRSARASACSGVRGSQPPSSGTEVSTIIHVASSSPMSPCSPTWVRAVRCGTALSAASTHTPSGISATAWSRSRACCVIVMSPTIVRCSGYTCGKNAVPIRPAASAAETRTAGSRRSVSRRPASRWAASSAAMSSSGARIASYWYTGAHTLRRSLNSRESRIGRAISVSGLRTGRNSSGTKCRSQRATFSGWSNSTATAFHGWVSRNRTELRMSGPRAVNCQ